MKRIVTGKQMKTLDSHTIENIGIPSLVLMERAAHSVYTAIKENFSQGRILVLCGSGNNGADGVAVARMLHMDGRNVDVWIIGQEKNYTPEMRKQTEIAEKCHVSFVKNAVPDEYTTIVDAIFGVGLSRNVEGAYREVIEEINNRTCGKVISVDIPSGVDADTGRLLGCAVKADVTVTFAYQKAGLLFYPGALYAGRIITADIGICWMDPHPFETEIFACQPEDFLKIPGRAAEGNKGTFGKIFLAAGSREMSGAPLLCASAAMRTGAGMIKVHTREENRNILGTMLPEAMYSFYGDSTIEPEKIRQGMAWADVIGVGPGLGTNRQAEEILRLILKEGDRPLVIDADGLNLLKDNMELFKAYKKPVILTPHLGEYARLSGISPEKWKENPLYHTRHFAEKWGAVLVCKDARTVVSDGGRAVYINASGNNGMATAGCGDVLTGILLGLLAQGMQAKDAASLGVYIHGAAGDMAADALGAYALTARDIITYASVIFKERGQKK